MSSRRMVPALLEHRRLVAVGGQHLGVANQRQAERSAASDEARLAALRRTTSAKLRKPVSHPAAIGIGTPPDQPPPMRAIWRYGSPAILLHWLMAVLIAGMLALGWYMTSLDDETRSGRYFALHMSVGILVAVLNLLRTGWRLAHRPRRLPASVPPWQRTAAHATHWLLYIAMALMPITGFLGASRTEMGVVFLGQSLPRMATADQGVAAQCFAIHSMIAWALVALVIVHVLAALEDLWVAKNGVFQRMSPGVGASRRP